MGVRVTLSLPPGVEDAPRGAFTTAVSQPRRNGPIVVRSIPNDADPSALIWRVYNYLLNTQQATVKQLKNKFRNYGVESIKATIRDLRKKGIPVVYTRTDAAYRIAA